MTDGSTKRGKISLVNGAGHGQLVLELYLKVNTQACLKSAAPIRYQQDSDKPTCHGTDERLAGDYFSFAYSAFAAMRIGMSGSASFQRAKKS